MNIAFRVDAAPHIGLGHFMRCLALADAVGARGARTRFVSRHLSPLLHEMLTARGHELSLLDTAASDEQIKDLPYSHWLGTSQATDALATIEALSPERWDWAIVDHYALDARWETTVRAAARRILVIDDTADRRHECDVLLDQNLFADMATRYQGLAPERCRLLLGPHYALLRKEFAFLREITGVRADGVKRILVLFGGVDARNETEKVIRAITLHREKAVDVDVVIGADHSARTQVAELCAQYGFGFYVQASGVAELMARADLAVGATGSTSWERCCLGLPAVCITSGANEVPIAHGLAARGAIVDLGDGATVTPDTLSVILQRLICNPSEVMAMSVAARTLVDGRGVDRVRDTLEAA